jgi:hypothetical protein
VLPALALLAVLAFVASFIIGLGRSTPRRAARTPAPAPAAQTLAVPDSRVRVQVLNGSRQPGLARLATDQLRAAGFDVVSIGNARTSVRNSVVVDRTGQRAIAERVAAALAIASVETRVDTALYLEVTVILGPEWQPTKLRD